MKYHTAAGAGELLVFAFCCRTLTAVESKEFGSFIEFVLDFLQHSDLKQLVINAVQLSGCLKPVTQRVNATHIRRRMNCAPRIYQCFPPGLRVD